MEWIRDNWFFVLFAAFFIGMHFLGYGCGHGRHSKHRAKEECDEHKEQSDGSPTGAKVEKKGHGCCG